MFSQFKKVNNESGVVLFIVLMVAIIIMIFSVAMMTQSANELNYAQTQIDQITCDQLKTSYYWSSYAANSLVAGNYTPPPINGRTYTVTLSSVGDVWQVQCSYDSLQ